MFQKKLHKIKILIKLETLSVLNLLNYFSNFNEM